jgi:hypothetical protein
LTQPTPPLGAGDDTLIRRFAFGELVVTVAPLALAALVAPPPFRRIGLALGLVVVVAYTGHIASSALLLRFHEVRAQLRARPSRRLGAPAVLLVALAIASGAVPVVRFSDVVLAFLAWQLWHFQKQNLGLVALVASHQPGAGLERRERIALLAAGGFGIVSLLARPNLLDLHIHDSPTPIVLTATVGFALTVACGTAFLMRRMLGGSWSGPVSLLYAAGLLFFLPAFLFTRSLAAVTGMAIAHGMQYLWVLRQVDGLTGHETEHAARRTSPWLLVGCAALGGSILTILGSYRSSPEPMMRVLGGLYLGLVCMHFAFDGSIWRMRDPWSRRFVTSHLQLLHHAAPLIAPSGHATHARAGISVVTQEGAVA